MRTIQVFSLAILAFLATFTATAVAAAATLPADVGFDMLKPVYDAFVHGQKLYAGMLALVVAVGLLKRYAPSGKIRDFVQGDTGGSLLTLVASFAGAMATSLGGGVAVSWEMVKTATSIAVGAAGGYTLFKRLVVDPILRPLASKAPTWTQPIFALVFWMFDKPSPVAQAEAAGDAAVSAAKPNGVSSVVGNVKDVE